ncbi:MAG: hypothetical protein F4Y44_10835 [Chloroflexi bacterium]|nr:hypothetical protein [Chloroflexota bacterium]
MLDEIIRALGILIGEYGTSVRENRFIVGGGTERILTTAMRCVGVTNARARGLGVDEEDIVVGQHQISVKASFTGGRQQIRLINTLGDSVRRGDTATIFVLANVGIGYADPDILPDADRSTSDAVVLPRAPLDNLHTEQPQWLLPCDIPANPTDSAQLRAASEAVTMEILQRTAAGRAIFPRLRVFI